MISTSTGYKTEVWTNDNRRFLHYADITLLDGTVINLDNTNIWQGGFRLEEAVSSMSSMDVGSCIASQLTLIINNISGSYDGTDFEGASVVAFIGLMVNGSEEKFQRGVYFVDEMEYSGNLITLTCLDAMVSFDKDYSESSLAYPATLSQIVSNICSVCGVTLASSVFPNSNYTVLTRPDDTALTCREVLSCALQIACSFGRINSSGQLEIGWMSPETLRWVDVAGDSWSDYSSVRWNSRPIAYPDFSISGFSSFKADFRGIAITGVEVAKGANTVLAGNDTYIVSVENNVLVSEPSTVANLMYPYIVGFSFWPYEAEHLSDPSMQAGDCVLLTDQKGNDYFTFATSISYTAGSYESTGCYAESYRQNASTRYSSAASAAARASQNATGNNGGYVTMRDSDSDGMPDELLIMDTTNIRTATEVWKGSKDGIAHSSTGYNGTYNIALTADGGLNCEYGEIGGWKVDAVSLYNQFVLDGNTHKVQLGAAEGYNYFTAVVNGQTRSYINRNGAIGAINPGTQNYAVLFYSRLSFYAPGTVPLGRLEPYAIHSDESQYGISLYGQSGVIVESGGQTSIRAEDTLFLRSYNGSVQISAPNGSVIMPPVVSHTTSSAANVYINSTGYLYCSTSSSCRYKEAITEDLGDLDPEVLYDLPVVRFRFKDDYISEEDERYGKDVIGFIAEDVDELFPVAVRHEDGQAEMWESNYMIPAMMELIKRQKNEIDAFKEQIASLEARLKALEERI